MKKNIYQIDKNNQALFIDEIGYKEYELLIKNKTTGELNSIELKFEEIAMLRVSINQIFSEIL